jgi:hypothetical protein
LTAGGFTSRFENSAAQRSPSSRGACFIPRPTDPILVDQFDEDAFDAARVSVSPPQNINKHPSIRIRFGPISIRLPV